MKKLILLFIFTALTLGSFAQIGINTTAPDSSAVLDLNSNNKGLLIPTMTTVQRDAMAASPPATGLATGLLVYDTDIARFYFWDIDKWVVLNNWRKEYTDNTLDNEHVYIDLENSSNVGINENSPNSKLTVNGNLSVGANTAAPTDGAYVDGQVKIGYSGTITDKLIVEGNTSTTATSTADIFVGRGVAPVGLIGMYSGSTAGLFDGTGLGESTTKMRGWAICNGNNGTPDLRDKFVVGAGSTYSVSNTGGENTHTLIINEMPSHSHTGNTTSNGNHRHPCGTRGFETNGNQGADGSTDDSNINTQYAGSHTHSLNINNTGNSVAHENRPPYYAVYYIMRIN